MIGVCSRIRIRDVFDELLITITGLVLLLPQLNRRALRVWDEGIYAAASSNVLFDGHWLAPHLYRNVPQYIPFFDKPPLTLWLQSVSMMLFGTSTFAARLPSTLAAILIAVVCYRVGQHQFDRRVGLIAGLVFLALPSTLSSSHAAMAATTDMHLILFGSLFVYWTWRFTDAERPIYCAVGAGVLAVLAKGVAAGVFVVVVLPLVVFRWREFLDRDVVGWIALGAAGICVWPVLMLIRYGDTFVEQFLFNQVLRRATTQLGPETATPLIPWFQYPYYRVGIEATFGLPVTVALVGATGYSIWRWHTRRQVRDWLFVWWLVAVPLTFGTLGGGKLWYLYPMSVPGAILLGRLGAAITRLPDRISSMPVALNDVDVAAFGVLGVIVMAGLYLPPVSTGATGQAALGSAIEGVPDGETVYIERSLLEGPSTVFWYPLDFYTGGQELDSATSPSSEMVIIVPQDNVTEYRIVETIKMTTVRTGSGERIDVVLTRIGGDSH